jgi:hypothetical protein
MVLAATEERKDVNVKTAQLVQLITKMGPDIPEIARKLGQFKESVRYRYKEKLVSKGFAVQAMPDHERLGLKRLMMIADFDKIYSSYSQAILAAMNELSFVVSYAKSIPDGSYVVNFSVPREHAEQLRAFLRYLRDEGMFSRFELLEFDWLRNVPMRAEYYDFDTGRWDYDWATRATSDSGVADRAPSGPAKFDYTDLQIIKELQMDANKSLKEISDNLKINYKKLAWHYNTHVIQDKLIKGYRVNWMGTRYDYKIDKALNRKHRYVGIDLFVMATTEHERAILAKKFSQLPFLWAEAGGPNYFAEIAFPVDYVVEGLGFLEDALSIVKGRFKMLFMDQSNAVAFTIPYEAYDQSRKQWNFDQVDLTARFDNLIQQIAERAG